LSVTVTVQVDFAAGATVAGLQAIEVLVGLPSSSAPMSGASPISRSCRSTSNGALAPSTAPLSIVGEPGSWWTLSAASSGGAVMLPLVPGAATIAVPGPEVFVSVVA